MHGRTVLPLAALMFFVGQIGAQAKPDPKYVVFFTEWSGALNEAAGNIIGAAAAAAKNASNAPIVITGFADRKGSVQANKLLSQLRAQVVMDALHNDGVPARQMRMVVAGGQSDTGVIDRRVEITLGVAH